MSWCDNEDPPPNKFVVRSQLRSIRSLPCSRTGLYSLPETDWKPAGFRPFRVCSRPVSRLMQIRSAKRWSNSLRAVLIKSFCPAVTLPLPGKSVDAHADAASKQTGLSNLMLTTDPLHGHMKCEFNSCPLPFDVERHSHHASSSLPSAYAAEMSMPDVQFLCRDFDRLAGPPIGSCTNIENAAHARVVVCKHDQGLFFALRLECAEGWHWRAVAEPAVHGRFAVRSGRIEHGRRRQRCNLLAAQIFEWRVLVRFEKLCRQAQAAGQEGCVWRSTNLLKKQALKLRVAASLRSCGPRKRPTAIGSSWPAY